MVPIHRLELAKQGDVVLRQREDFAAIHVAPGVRSLYAPPSSFRDPRFMPNCGDVRLNTDVLNDRLGNLSRGRRVNCLWTKYGIGQRPTGRRRYMFLLLRKSPVVSMSTTDWS
jgi:hypothetical protein